jgi:hypothetical protein
MACFGWARLRWQLSRVSRKHQFLHLSCQDAPRNTRKTRQKRCSRTSCRQTLQPNCNQLSVIKLRSVKHATQVMMVACRRPEAAPGWPQVSSRSLQQQNGVPFLSFHRTMNTTAVYPDSGQTQGKFGTRCCFRTLDRPGSRLDTNTCHRRPHRKSGRPV